MASDAAAEDAAPATLPPAPPAPSLRDYRVRLPSRNERLFHELLHDHGSAARGPQTSRAPRLHDFRPARFHSRIDRAPVEPLDASAAVAEPTPRRRDFRIRIPSRNERMLHEQFHEQLRSPRLLDFLKASPSADGVQPLSAAPPSPEAPSPASSSVGHFHFQFIRKVDWSAILGMCLDWLQHPMNIALLLWLLAVAASGTMLVLLLVGLLNRVFDSESLRNSWIEIDNQVLNALFTLMSIYQHPSLCHHLFLLCRWRSDDAVELRKAYCKDAARRPHERFHLTVVVILLHLTLICQYVLCGLYWGFSARRRPELAEDSVFVLGIVAPVLAVMYTVCSPLGREMEAEPEPDEEWLLGGKPEPQQKATNRVAVASPEWAGGLFDCGEDATVGCLSFFCTCCVFGWNMERLGFGNRYVHVATFVLLCVAPLWIFGVTAMRIHNEVIGDTIGVAGIALCAFGLVYGGFWRIQMRKRFGLPGGCGGSKLASLADYLRWMFCWSCALAQEVRTANLYDIEDDNFYEILMATEEEDDGFPDDSGAGPAMPGLVVKADTASPSTILTVVQEPPQIGKMVESLPLLAPPPPQEHSSDDGGGPPEMTVRVRQWKRVIGVVGLVSVLFLLYTRGFPFVR